MIDYSIKMLVADDMKSMRSIIKSLLREMGIVNIVEAEDGIDALQKLSVGNFDMAMIDWNMPRMNGITLLRSIRADPLLSNLLVLLVTAEATQDKVTEAAYAGANGYVLKPFTVATLSDKINKILLAAPPISKKLRRPIGA